MKEYQRQVGFVQALQWNGTNKNEMRKFCPKVQFKSVLDNGGTFEIPYLFEEGFLIEVLQGNYLIKEQGSYYEYPKRLFEKHYLEKESFYELDIRG